MKLFRFTHWEDFGHEFSLSIFQYANFCLFGFHLSTSDFFEFWPPRLMIVCEGFSPISVFSLSINIWSVGLEFVFWSDLEIHK